MSVPYSAQYRKCLGSGGEPSFKMCGPRKQSVEISHRCLGGKNILNDTTFIKNSGFIRVNSWGEMLCVGKGETPGSYECLIWGKDSVKF